MFQEAEPHPKAALPAPGTHCTCGEAVLHLPGAPSFPIAEERDTCPAASQSHGTDEMRRSVDGVHCEHENTTHGAAHRSTGSRASRLCPWLCGPGSLGFFTPQTQGYMPHEFPQAGPGVTQWGHLWVPVHRCHRWLQTEQSAQGFGGCQLTL